MPIFLRELVAFVVLAVLAAPTAGALPTDGPGGACDGLLDVLCVDEYDPCPFTGPCEPVPYRECVVWIFYLDMTLPVEHEGVCMDDPYHGWP